MHPDTKEVYDYDSYMQAVESGGNLTLLGKLERAEASRQDANMWNIHK